MLCYASRYGWWRLAPGAVRACLGALTLLLAVVGLSLSSPAPASAAPNASGPYYGYDAVANIAPLETLTPCTDTVPGVVARHGVVATRALPAASPAGAAVPVQPAAGLSYGQPTELVAPTSAADDLLGAACRTNSFVPGTAVLMADGTTRAIEDVEIGDYVWATDPETGETGPRRVIGDGEKQLVDIQVDGGVITATNQHPFWVDDRGRWIDAEDLTVGDHLELVDGSTVAVGGLAARTEEGRVHNLTIHGIDTYFVVAGDAEVLVHNCGSIDPSSVRFSQDSISGIFRNGGSVDDLIGGLRSGAIDPSDIPAVRLVERNGQLVSIDNCRLYAFQQAGVPIQYRMATAGELAEAIRRGKFTSTNGGTSIRVGGG